MNCKIKPLIAISFVMILALAGSVVVFADEDDADEQSEYSKLLRENNSLKMINAAYRDKLNEYEYQLNELESQISAIQPVLVSMGVAIVGLLGGCIYLYPKRNR